MRQRTWGAIAASLCLTVASLVAQTSGGGIVQESDLRRYLTYLASDELMGREVFTEGYGAASQYVADELKEIGAKPLGDPGSYFQMVALNDIKVISDNSSVTERKDLSLHAEDRHSCHRSGAAHSRQSVDGLPRSTIRLGCSPVRTNWRRR